MTKYYFVSTLLPTLSFEASPDLTFAELDRLFRDNLTAKDYEKTLLIRRFFDLLNLRAWWKGEPLDTRGVLPSGALEEAVGGRTGFPDYVYEFIDRHPKTEDRLRHFPFLLAKFFQSVEEVSDPLLRHYLFFERELRLVMVAFRAKKLGRDLSLELQYEDPEEELVAQLLAQKDADSYELPEKYQSLKALFEQHGDHPLLLQRGLDQYRYDTLEGFVDMADLFSIERLLVYLLQFVIVEAWFTLDRTKGAQIVDTIAKEEHHHGKNG